MPRQIYIVNATQVVASESNPQGVYSNIAGYPITRDRRITMRQIYTINII